MHEDFVDYADFANIGLQYDFINNKFKYKMKDSVIIVSGGMDSITLLYDKKDEIALGISFNYGSNHNEREIPYAKMHCERLGIKHITIDLGFMHQYFKSSLLEGADAIPEGHYADENMKSTVVPFRNGIMLSIAIGIAESNNLKKVLIANHGGDHTIYPDCVRSLSLPSTGLPRQEPLSMCTCQLLIPTSPRRTLPV